MDHTDAAETLGSLIDASGKTEAELTSADLLELVLQFFETPCNGSSREGDADALLFQSGVYDWGQGDDLEIDFVRQFAIYGFDGEFDHSEQLHATLFYPPALAAGQEVALSIWNTECADMADFRQKVTESVGYKLTEKVVAPRFKIHQERL